MVQILRPQTRNYAADKSGAIETAQLAQNIKEWGNVIKGVGSVYSAFEKGAAAREAERAQADEQMINTQIGQKADILADRKIQEEIKAGKLNPNTTAGQKRIEEIVAEQYAPYQDQGQTEKFNTTLATMQRKAADKGLERAFRSFDAKKKKDASDSLDYINLYNSSMAEEAGKNGDFDTYMSFTESTTKPVVDYVVAHSSNKDKQDAENKWRLRQGTSYLIGMAQSKPVEAARIIGIQDRQAVEDLLKEQNPKMGKKEIKRLTDDIMKSENQLADEKLEKIFGNKVINAYGEDDATAYSNLRQDLQKALGRMVRKGMAQQELNAKQENYSNVVNTFSDVMNPNPVISANASMSIENGIEDISEDFMKEAPNIKESLNIYQENTSKVKEEKFPTMEATVESVKQIQAFALSDKQKPAQKVELALDTANSIHDEPVTQQQYEEANNIMYNALSDSDYDEKLKYSMGLVSATVLDNYADLFPDFEDLARLEKETDPEFREYSSMGIRSGIEKEVTIDNQEGQITLDYSKPIPQNIKTKAKSFDWEKTDEKSKAKYNLIKDTYAGVQADWAQGNFEEANKKIFELPYGIAKINYFGRISPAIIDQFMQIDLDGKQSVYPQFEYNGYSFQYMGIDRKTGVIKAKRFL